MRLVDKGFTLIELIVVIAIIGVIAGIAVPTYFNLVQDAKYSKLLGAQGAIGSSASIISALYVASGGDKSKASDSFTLNDGSTVRIRYGYPRGIDIINYTNLTGYHITSNNNRVDIRIKEGDKTFLRYNPKRNGLLLAIRGKKENL